CPSTSSPATRPSRRSGSRPSSRRRRSRRTCISGSARALPARPRPSPAARRSSSRPLRLIFPSWPSKRARFVPGKRARPLFSLVAPGLGLVAHQDISVLERAGLRPLQVLFLVDAVERRPALAEDDGMDDDLVLVDQTLLRELRDDAPAPEDGDV